MSASPLKADISQRLTWGDFKPLAKVKTSPLRTLRF